MADDPKKPGEEQDGTARIELTPEQKKKAGTARINLSGGQGKPDTRKTARIPAPDQNVDTVRIDPNAETVEAKTREQPVVEPPPARPNITQRSQTQRISLTAARPPQKTEEPREGVRNKTMRVEIVDGVKRETSKVPAPPSARKPGGTQRVALEAQPVEDDALSRHVPAPGGAPSAERPRTVRVSKKPTVGEEEADTESATVAEAAPAAPAAAPTKSQTARIDLPPDIGAGRPKTIKIKRSEAAAPEAPAAPAAPAATKAQAKASAKAAAKAPKPKVSAAVGTGPGTAYTLMAIAAVLIVGVLVYMLLAQTLIPGLPFPGKIGV